MLFEQARCEELFGTVNVLNGQTMEPLDSQEFMPEQKRAAIINARDIEKQILTLVRHFSKKAHRDKLVSVFGSVLRGGNNEIEAFNDQFKLLRKLFNIKLSTAVEEVNQMQDATAKLKTSTETLEQNLK